MHPGIQQDQRLSPALDGAYVRPDELSLAQRLRQLLVWSRQIRFVETTGQTAGHWGEMLESDLSFVLAELATLPVDAWLAEVEDWGRWPLQEQRQRCLALAQALDHRYHLLRAHLDAGQGDQPGQTGQTGLTGHLQRQADLIGERLGHVLGPTLRRIEAQDSSAKSWHPDWLRSRSAKDTPVALTPRDYRLFWLSLCRLLDNLRAAAQQHLQASLSTQTHDPALGLLIAWTRLLQGSRAPLDRFHDRLTHHYYGQRLKLPRTAGQATRVHLVLERQPLHGRTPYPLHVPAGSRFIAAVDSASLSVASMHAMPLSALKVKHLLTLAQAYHPDISPERDYGYASRTMAWQGQPPTLQSTITQEIADHPPLGGSKDSHEARQGLAIASPLLALQEGERDIHVHLHMAQPKGIQGVQGAQEGQGRAQASAALCQRLADQEWLEGWRPPAPRSSGDRQNDLPWDELLKELFDHDPDARQTPWLTYLVIRCLHSPTPDSLKPWLGRLLAVWLCATREELSPASLGLLRSHTRAVLGNHDKDTNKDVKVDDPLALLFSHKALERSLIFDRVFRGAWTAKLSTEGGWLDGVDVFVLPNQADQADQHSQESQENSPRDEGIHLLLRLRADHPAIVPVQPASHGQAWAPRPGSSALPVLQLQLQSRSRLFASSLLQQLGLDSVSVRVDVRGVRTLELHNQMGRLDASKPFMPFGPLPENSSYVLLGHPELARKPLQQLRLHLRWSGLPTVPWSHYHEAYQAAYPDTPWRADALRVQPALLLDGQWQTGPDKTLPLFAHTPQGQVQPDQVIDLGQTPLLRLHRPAVGSNTTANATANTDTYSLLSRQGYIRLQLSNPAFPHAFGHALYPRLMTERLMANSRLKKPEPLPNPPYTPTISAISVDYSASERIPARQDASANALSAPTSELLHLGPFGVHPLGQIPQSRPIHVLQRWPSQGQLLIGLQYQGGQGEQGPSSLAAGGLSLLFKLRSQAAVEPLGRALPTLRWQVWCADDWRDLEPYRVLMDSTEGLLRTGVIMLDLPEGMTLHSPGLPPDCFWLRLLGDGDLSLLAGLQGVWTNGLVAELQDDADLARPLPAQSIQAAEDPVPGLAGVLQPWPSFGGRAAQTSAQWITHMAERLRHRARAASPWDYERLVLEAFPAVHKVKCIPCSEPKLSKPKEGSARWHALTVVVVPALPAGSEADGIEAPKLDAATLTEIQRFLAARMPPGQPLLVRNAVYERIQVRGSLRLNAGEPAGERLRQLNTALRDFLSPWREGGLTTHFDWQLRAEDIEALLRHQPGVASVGQVSLLHITSDDAGHHRLDDTARELDNAALGQPSQRPQSLQRLLRPAHPWSLALPTHQHLLDLREHPAPHAPVSGLSRLTLGSSFIIGHPTSGQNSA